MADDVDVTVMCQIIIVVL